MSNAVPTATRLPAAQHSPRWRVRVRLADLMLWVLGAGVAAAACRESKPASWLTPWVELGRPFGLSAALLAILLGIGLLRQAVTYARLRSSAGGPPLSAIVWRMVVVALLGAAVVDEVRLLSRVAVRVDWETPQSVRLSLLPLAMTFAMAGLLAGLSPGRGRAVARLPRLAWLSVVLAVAAGVAITANEAVIPYLVLIVDRSDPRCDQGTVRFAAPLDRHRAARPQHRDRVGASPGVLHPAGRLDRARAPSARPKRGRNRRVLARPSLARGSHCRGRGRSGLAPRGRDPEARRMSGRGFPRDDRSPERRHRHPWVRRPGARDRGACVRPALASAV